MKYNSDDEYRFGGKKDLEKFRTKFKNLLEHILIYMINPTNVILWTHPKSMSTHTVYYTLWKAHTSQNDSFEENKLLEQVD